MLAVQQKMYLSPDSYLKASKYLCFTVISTHMAMKLIPYILHNINYRYCNYIYHFHFAHFERDLSVCGVSGVVTYAFLFY